MLVYARLKAVMRSIREGVQVALAGYKAGRRNNRCHTQLTGWASVQATVVGRLDDLLPDIADVAFADLAMQATSDEEYNQVLGGWKLIQACRREGIAAAVDAQ